MTNKRFTETLSTGVVTDHVTGKEYNCEMRIDDKLLELLNELHDECEFLKIDNEALEDGATKYAELCHKLSKENEQLKKDIEYYKTERLALFEYLDKKDDLKLELKVEK